MPYSGITNSFAPKQSISERHNVSYSVRDSRLPSVLFLCTVLFCLTAWASPPLALLLGFAVALSCENPFPQASKKIASWLLKGCVVLLGFGMNLSVVLRAGVEGMLFAAVSIAATLLLGAMSGRWLRIDPRTSGLISAGTAICGGSAIAAVGAVTGATDGEMTVAMGTIFLLNAAALYLFPVVGHMLHLSQRQFGTWSGVAIHDISSVVGAASRYGLSALQTATAVKLSRALWIVPVSLGAAIAFGAPRIQGTRDATVGFDPRQGTPRNLVQVPWFIGLFLLASVIRSLIPGIACVAPSVSRLATTGLTVTLFLIGAGLSRTTLKSVGWRPLLQGLLLWGCISIGALLVILKVLP